MIRKFKFILLILVFDQIIRLSFQKLGKCLYHLLEPIETNKKSKKMKNGTLKKQREHFKYWHRYSGLAKKYMEALNIVSIFFFIFFKLLI